MLVYNTCYALRYLFGAYLLEQDMIYYKELHQLYMLCLPMTLTS